jgi:hypothetical protein
MVRPVTKDRITVTIDLTVIRELARRKDSIRYANLSAITNELLRQALTAEGVKLET